MDIEEVDFDVLVNDIADKHFALSGSPSLSHVIHYCLFDEILNNDNDVDLLAVQCQQVLRQMGFTANDLFWKRNNYGTSSQAFERLMEDLELDYEFENDCNFVRIRNRKYPEYGDVIMTSGLYLKDGETKWSRYIDHIYEAKLNKYSWLYGYTYCDCDLNDEIDTKSCPKCGGIGRVKHESVS